jgi:hypothetical protein
MRNKFKNCFRAVKGSWRSNLFLGMAAISFLLITVSSPMAEVNRSMIPGQYGEVIYHRNERSPNQLYIIGISHRNSLNRSNGSNTSRVQAEVYKIGEWLVLNRGLKLLLPEGFFENKRTAENGKERACSDPIDIKAVEERLSDDGTYVNAEMLLMAYHPLRMRQVEDNELYNAVYNGIKKLVNHWKNPDACDYFTTKSELDYFQERRTAFMLQRIPEVIDEEIQQGRIKQRKAIFTVGISHLPKIIEYLNAKKVTVYAPISSQSKNEDYTAELNLAKENFGIEVIVPRTLADDDKILELNKLDKMVIHSRAIVPSLATLP